MAITLELLLNGTASPTGRYVGWSPAPAQLRVLNADGAVDPIHVRLASPAGRGGRVVFAPRRDAEAGDEIELDLATDGTPTDFWVLGRFQSPSRNDRDARIAVFTPGRVTPLVSFWLMVRVRKDAQTLTYYEKRRLLSALARVDAAAVGLYQSYRDAHTADTSDEAHDLDAFLPWHRAYLLDLERELQAVDPSVTIPYWRFDQPAPQLFAESFLGRSEPIGVCGSRPSTRCNCSPVTDSSASPGCRGFDVATQMAGNINGPVIEEAVVINAAIPVCAAEARRWKPRKLTRAGARQLHRRLHQPDPRRPSVIHSSSSSCTPTWTGCGRSGSGSTIASTRPEQDSYFFRTPAEQSGLPPGSGTTLPTPCGRGATFAGCGPSHRTAYAVPDLASGGGPGRVTDRRSHGRLPGRDRSLANRLGFDYDDVPFSQLD